MQLARSLPATALTIATFLMPTQTPAQQPQIFQGQHYRGVGDAEHLKLLDVSARMFHPDPEFQNLSMLYMPSWNGLVEGPTWDAWWVQNSYGTTYSILPFLEAPFTTFLQNSQDLWFDQMGDGKRSGEHGWVAPDGCLCDAAKPGWIYYKQGDGKTAIHDWGMEFTAAGVVMQAELLLISRDPAAIQKYLPRLERSANFIETRRDPQNNLFLAGPAGNLLAPSYAGWKKPDGTYDKAYLAGLSVTYIAALDRLIELEKLAGKPDAVATYTQRRDTAKAGLKNITSPDGYLYRSIDPDGTVHGNYGAPRHGYLETSPNHDAIAFRVADDAQSQKIYQKIAAIPELRPHAFILPNYPSYDDMYEPAQGLWSYGTWVNGGHWSTCEARMILAYHRLGQYADAKTSMQRLLAFARQFRMDNPLTQMGAAVYQPNESVNLCYDSFGPPAAMMRGLFEYLYRADALTLVPHIPPTITYLEQTTPVRFGQKRLRLTTHGTGPITAVQINGQPYNHFTATEITLPYSDEVPKDARIAIALGGATFETPIPTLALAPPLPPALRDFPADLASLKPKAERLQRFVTAINATDKAGSYEAAHARLATDAIAAALTRATLVKSGGTLPKLPDATQKAADQSYLTTAEKLYDGLDKLLTPRPESDPVATLWRQSAP
jgi:hypothetical protein